MFGFNQKKEVAELQNVVTILLKKVAALEDYLDVDYFNGPKYKPHYRKRKTITKKLGRPRKVK